MCIFVLLEVNQLFLLMFLCISKVFSSIMRKLIFICWKKSFINQVNLRVILILSPYMRIIMSYGYFA